MKLAIAITALAVLFAMPALAQGRNCGLRTDVLERLAAKYGETRQSIGLGKKGAVMEIFANLKTGSWTATITTTSGLTCLVASGTAFERINDESPTGSPT